MDSGALRTLGDQMRDKMDCGIAIFASEAGDKITFSAAASKSAVAKGVHAGKIIGEIAKVCGGGGGGKPDSAQAGGKDASKIDEALALATSLVDALVK